MMTTSWTIGTYRVLRELGSGGMGEVFLAYDPELEREVAIKRIHRAVAGSPERRARFRREARLAASLNHPAIVGVHHLLTEVGREHIVMEYVDGTTLHALLKERGRLPVQEGLKIAITIVDGLAYAHDQGIIHRDLKSENILLGSSGETKIADFGIARQLREAKKEHARQRDSYQSSEGLILGTYRAMSPEQVLGRATDQRSDLFAFGVLLYEMFTGVSPFLTKEKISTVDRILKQRPTSPKALVEEIPAPLSGLIQQLLEKVPQLRPGTASEVQTRLRRLLDESSDQADQTLTLTGLGGEQDEEPPDKIASEQNAPEPDRGTRMQPSTRYATSHRIFWGAALLVGLALFLIFRLSPRESQSTSPLTYLAVLEPKVLNPSREPNDLLVFAARTAMTQTLVGMDGIALKSSSEVDAVIGTPTEIARAVGVDEFLTTTLLCETSRCQVEVNRIQASDGAVIWIDTFETTKEPFEMARLIAGRLRSAFGESEGESENWPIQPEDFEVYLNLLQDFGTSPRQSDIEQALTHLAELRQRAPKFYPIHLLEAQMRARQYFVTQDSKVLQKGFELVEVAHQLAPNHFEVEATSFYLQMVGGRLEEAGRTLQALERRFPQDQRLMTRKMMLLERQARLAEAMELSTQILAIRPSWQAYLSHASLASKMGKVALARDSLEKLLELSPENYRGLSALAQLELAQGDVKRAVELYKQLVEGYSGLTELSNLGVAYQLLGDYEASGEIFVKILEEAPDHPVYLLNLADARWLAGRREEATTLYKKVLRLTVEAGALEWQTATVRAQALAHLDRRREAVNDIQSVLHNLGSQVAFEAALVYALVGDENAALANVERALKQGWGEHWFRLPWFDQIRKNHEFGELIAAYRSGV